MNERRLLAPSMRIGTRTFVWGERTYVMGVINVSPESFSGDGVSSVDDAVAQARRFVKDGADILDVGGQSTRPGAVKTAAGFDEIAPEDEIARVVPVIERLRAELPETPISVDTYKPDVARAALAADAHLLNSIEGFRRDASLARVAAAAGVPAAIMHNQRGRTTTGVMHDILAGLRESVRIAGECGLPASMLIADPGFGFGWQAEENLEIIRRLDDMHVLALPVLIGTSRKSTIGAVLGSDVPSDRLFGTAATVALSIAHGADIVRVHDVAAMKQVAIMTDAVVRGWHGGTP